MVPYGGSATDTLYQDSIAAEEGLYDDSHKSLAVPPPVHTSEKEPISYDVSPLSLNTAHTSSTTISSLPVTDTRTPNLSLTHAPSQKPLPSPKKPKRRTLLSLWFHTYRKFFIFTTLLNFIGIVLASLGRFQYAENHLGALVLGNLLFAVLMRNELLLRVLYMVAIYGLRSV